MTVKFSVHIKGAANAHYDITEGKVTRARLLKYITAMEQLAAITGRPMVHWTTRNDGFEITREQRRAWYVDGQRQKRRERIIKWFPWAARWLGRDEGRNDFPPF